MTFQSIDVMSIITLEELVDHDQKRAEKLLSDYPAAGVAQRFQILREMHEILDPYFDSENEGDTSAAVISRDDRLAAFIAGHIGGHNG